MNKTKNNKKKKADYYSLLLCLDGEHDWMDPLGGLKSVEKLKEAGNHSGKMVVVPNAGHHG